MRALRIHQLGGPEGLRIDDLPEPSPGPGEAAVRVRAASLNYRDLMVLRGQYNPKIALPAVPLSDGAGHVTAVGPGVTRVKPGDRVASAFMPGWLGGDPTDAGARSALGAGGAGMLAETVVVPAEGLVAIPDHLTFEEASTLPCAAVTAWHAVVTEGRVKAGDTVLVQGTGGVSLFALQFARLNGARVIATSGSDEKLGRVLKLGASDGINYKTTPDWDKVARELTGGEGVDHVVEVGGAGTLTRSLRAARIGGRVSLIGVLTGGSSDVNVVPVLMRNLRVQGIFVGSVEMFEAMNRAIGLHRLRPVVDSIFPLDRAAEGFRHLESGAHFGKVVIRV
ncbi:MAG: NAD(P)-dependent alcohol dehydrogenase [Planctomycetia bacterium]|nr:NAD(P)-dependent alcohol dehydrogenase [Planctomycetia bacterium]